MDKEILSRHDLNEKILKWLMVRFSISQIQKILISLEACEVLLNRKYKPILINDFLNMIQKPFYNIVKNLFGEWRAAQTIINKDNILKFIDCDLYDLKILTNTTNGDKYLINPIKTPFDQIKEAEGSDIKPSVDDMEEIEAIIKTSVENSVDEIEEENNIKTSVENSVDEIDEENNIKTSVGEEQPEKLNFKETLIKIMESRENERLEINEAVEMLRNKGFKNITSRNLRKLLNLTDNDNYEFKQNHFKNNISKTYLCFKYDKAELKKTLVEIMESRKNERLEIGEACIMLRNKGFKDITKKTLRKALNFDDNDKYGICTIYFKQNDLKTFIYLK